MNENLRKKVVYGTLVLAVIYGAYNLWPESRAGRPSTASVSSQPVAAAAVSAISIPSPLDTARAEAAPWGEDPFRVSAPPVTTRFSGTPAPRWRLSGIIYNQTNPLAIIDGKSVGVGDQIRGATVLSIDRLGVTVDHQGKQYTLTVFKD